MQEGGPLPDDCPLVFIMDTPSSQHRTLASNPYPHTLLLLRVLSIICFCIRRPANASRNATTSAGPVSRLLQPQKAELRQAFNRTFAREIDTYTAKHGKPSTYTCPN